MTNTTRRGGRKPYPRKRNGIRKLTRDQGIRYSRSLLRSIAPLRVKLARDKMEATKGKGIRLPETEDGIDMLGPSKKIANALEVTPTDVSACLLGLTTVLTKTSAEHNDPWLHGNTGLAELQPDYDDLMEHQRKSDYQMLQGYDNFPAPAGFLRTSLRELCRAGYGLDTLHYQKHMLYTLSWLQTAYIAIPDPETGDKYYTAMCWLKTLKRSESSRGETLYIELSRLFVVVRQLGYGRIDSGFISRLRGLTKKLSAEHYNLALVLGGQDWRYEHTFTAQNLAELIGMGEDLKAHPTRTLKRLDKIILEVTLAQSLPGVATSCNISSAGLVPCSYTFSTTAITSFEDAVKVLKNIRP